MIHKIKDERDQPGIVGMIDFSIIEDTIMEIGIEIDDKKLGVCTAYVYPGEGPVPHFHLVSKEKEICICLYEPKYFSHGKHKLNPKDRLNNVQREVLNNWMKMANYGDDRLTNWEMLVANWKNNNPDNKRYNIRFPKEQPDYNNLVEEYK